MGYFQNLQVELEDIQDDELREIVAWDHAHRHLLTSEERWRILTNEVLLKRALVLWTNTDGFAQTRLAPKPAADHVALQTSRKDLRVRQPRSFCWVGWSLIGLAVATGVTVLVVSL
jgi:hypothetical protein